MSDMSDMSDMVATTTDEAETHTIRERDWPIIASSRWATDDRDSDVVWTFRLACLTRTRPHLRWTTTRADGRTIVYGRYDYVSHRTMSDNQTYQDGRLCDGDDSGDIVQAIHRVADMLNRRTDGLMGWRWCALVVQCASRICRPKRSSEDYHGARRRAARGPHSSFLSPVLSRQIHPHHLRKA